MSRPCRIDLVVGTRPNIVKLAPLADVLRSQDWCEERIVFLGQHTSPSLSDEIFEDVGIDASRIRLLPLAGDGYGRRLGEIIATYMDELEAARPDVVVVFGDVDVTLGASLAAKRMNIPLVHIEAGLRSGDMSMPEEMNRILVDAIADLYFAPSEDALNNLVFGEAKDSRKVHFVGNIMIDSLVRAIDPGVQARLSERLGIEAGEFSVATFHRPSNVDSRQALEDVVALLEHLASLSTVVLPLHPRTEASLVRHGLRGRIAGNARILDMGAIRYKEFVNLLALRPRLVLTDSGGIQEETTFLRVPCLTYRDNTERPVTIRLGTNTLVNRHDVREAINATLSPVTGRFAGQPRLPLWDGRASYRIASVIRNWKNGIPGDATRITEEP